MSDANKWSKRIPVETLHRILLSCLLIAVMGAMLSTPSLAEDSPPNIPMVRIESGDFLMGEEEADRGSALPVHRVHLDAYAIGEQEVSLAEFAAVVNWALDKGLAVFDPNGLLHYKDAPLFSQTPGQGGPRLEGSRVVIPPRDGHAMDAHPVVHVTWYGAVAFCNWLSLWQGFTPCYDLDTWTLVARDAGGFRLPSEAEWERAASWDATNGKRWEYGVQVTQPTIEQMNYFAWQRSGYANPLRLSGPPFTVPGTWYRERVGDTGSSAAGCLHMSGNVWEWCEDWYAADYYAHSPESNPLGPEGGTTRVQRGGSWKSDAPYCRTTWRNHDAPDFSLDDLGFRVARSLPKPDTPPQTP